MITGAVSARGAGAAAAVVDGALAVDGVTLFADALVEVVEASLVGEVDVDRSSDSALIELLLLLDDDASDPHPATKIVSTPRIASTVRNFMESPLRRQ